MPVAWSHRVVCPSIVASSFSAGCPIRYPDSGSAQGQRRSGAVEGTAQVPYAIPISKSVTVARTWASRWASGVRQAFAERFVVESFIDSWPRSWTDRCLSSDAAAGYLDTWACWSSRRKSGWGSPAAEAGRAVSPSMIVRELGSAIGGGLRRGRSSRVHRVVCAVDCGTVINRIPCAQMKQDRVRPHRRPVRESRNRGRARRAISTTGAHHAGYPSDRVHIVSSVGPGGVGEPATAHRCGRLNAVFAVTGKRVRSLPIVVWGGPACR
jgi:isoquinoline 1-oxidoreductase beta subunit